MDTVQTCSELGWKTDLTEKEGGWSRWINYTAMQRALSAHGRGTVQAGMKRWCWCFFAGTSCLMPAVLGHSSMRLSKGIQFTVKQGDRSLFPSWLQLLFVSAFVLAGLIHNGAERRCGRWELTLAPATSCFVGLAAQESTRLRHAGLCLQASFQSAHTFWSTPGSQPCWILGTVERWRE